MGWTNYFDSRNTLQFFDNTKTYGGDTGATSYTSPAALIFAAVGAGANATITDSAAGFTFVVGEVISVRGSTSNNGNYHVIGASASVLLLHMNHSLTNETAVAGAVNIRSYIIGTFPGIALHDNIHSLLVVSKTAAYTAFFDEMVLCDGAFVVTLPNIDSGDVGKTVIICNIGTGVITVDGHGNDTLYGELNMECISEATLSLRAATTSTWRLA